MFLQSEKYAPLCDVNVGAWKTSLRLGGRCSPWPASSPTSQTSSSLRTSPGNIFVLSIVLKAELLYRSLCM